MDTIAQVRHEHSLRQKAIKEIVRDLHVPRNAVRKMLRSRATGFEHVRTARRLMTARSGPSGST